MRATLISVIFAALFHSGLSNVSIAPKVSASLLDTVVDDIEGLHVDVIFPVNLDDYLLGAKLAVGNAVKFPDTLFAKKSFDVADGKLSLDAEFKSSDNKVSLASKWKSLKHGFTLGADVDSNIKNYITGLSFQKDDVEVQGTKASLSTSFDTIKKKIAGSLSLKSGDTTSTVKFDGSNPTFSVSSGDTTGTVSFDGSNPSLSVSKVLDANHVVTPSVDVANKKLSLEVLRKWAGGSLKSVFHANKADLEWRDEGVRGAWVTTAQIPINDNTVKPKVSISRDWKY